MNTPTSIDYNSTNVIRSTFYIYIIVIRKYQLTIEFVHGNTIPMLKRPSKGPANTPITLNDACNTSPNSEDKHAKPIHRSPYANTRAENGGGYIMSIWPTYIFITA